MSAGVLNELVSLPENMRPASTLSSCRHTPALRLGITPPPLHTLLLVRARPKSQILRSQFALTSRFDGFKSRWSMLAEWMNLSPRSTCKHTCHALNRAYTTPKCMRTSHSHACRQHTNMRSGTTQICMRTLRSCMGDEHMPSRACTPPFPLHALYYGLCKIQALKSMCQL